MSMSEIKIPSGDDSLPTVNTVGIRGTEIMISLHQTSKRACEISGWFSRPTASGESMKTAL